MSGPCGTEAEWSIVLPALQRHAEIAKQYGVKGVYHHHTNWIAETMEQTERLLAETDPTILRAMLDCGHATKDFVGHTAAEFFRRHHDRIDYVEFKDFTPASDLRTEVGRGQCDWQSVAAALREFNYCRLDRRRAERHDPHAAGERGRELPLHPGLLGVVKGRGPTPRATPAGTSRRTARRPA